MCMAKFTPRVSEDEIRAARRRIAAGESKRSVARSLGYSGSSPHKALQQRIDAQERREELERVEHQAYRATAEAEKKRLARGVRTGYGDLRRSTDRPEDRGGSNPSADIDRVRRQLDADAEARRRQLEREDRGRRFGLSNYRPGTEEHWLDEREAQRRAERQELARRAAFGRWEIRDLADRVVGRLPALTDDREAEAAAERSAARTLSNGELVYGPCHAVEIGRP
jgi:hypothetical protein